MPYGYYTGMGHFGWIWIILLWIAVIWLIIWLIRKDNFHADDKASKTALEILKERYAKGEITKKKFFDMKREIVP